MALDIPEVSAENVVAVVDLIAARPGADIAAAAAFADIPLEYAERALKAGVLLDLIVQSGDGFAPSGWLTGLFGAGSTDQKRQIFRAHLERFEPFAWVRLRVLQGYDLLAASKEAKALYDLDPSASVVRDVFSRWGTFARSFVGDPPTVDTSLGVDSPVAGVIDPLLDAGAAAEEFLSDALTIGVYVNLDKAVRDNLVLGVRRFLARDEPRTVGNPLGIAFEDYLRGIADRHHINVGNKNGIVEVAMELRSNRKLAKKHLGLVQAIGAFRNALEHGIDNDEGREWQVTNQGLRLMIGSVALGIKSLAAYEVRGDLDL